MSDPSNPTLAMLLPLIEKKELLPTGTDIRGTLEEASYFSPRDPRLLFDWTLDVDKNSEHIICHRLDRLIEAGVIDPAEAKWTASPANEPPLGAGFVWTPEPIANGMHFVVHEKTKTFFLSRGAFGKTALVNQLSVWIDEAVARARRCIFTVVPQYYYSQKNGKDFYVGSLQLLLPLYCGRTDCRLALSLDYQVEKISEGKEREYYRAATILKTSWAKSNARLLGPLHMDWLRE
eukprot:ANDGO_01326.mRNA.1 hypothetical protein